MKKPLAFALPLLLLLAGCSSTTAAPPSATPTPTQSANASACRDFAALTMTIVNKINSSEPANKMWEGLRTDFDKVALTATGTVKDRMLDLSEHWPDLSDIVLLHKFDDMNSKIQAVQRACTADGVTATFGTLSEK
jgi:hypothetical protein